MVFGKVETTSIPIKTKLVLGGTAAEPVEAHPQHFDAAVDDGVVDKSRGS